MSVGLMRILLILAVALAIYFVISRFTGKK